MKIGQLVQKKKLVDAAQPQADPIPGENYAEINNAALHNFIEIHPIVIDGTLYITFFCIINITNCDNFWKLNVITIKTHKIIPPVMTSVSYFHIISVTSPPPLSTQKNDGIQHHLAEGSELHITCMFSNERAKTVH